MAFVVDALIVLLHVRVTAVSNSALAVQAVTSAYIQYFSSSIQLSEVTGISPVALSILISNPHDEARVVVVGGEIAQASGKNKLRLIVLYIKNS